MAADPLLSFLAENVSQQKVGEQHSGGLVNAKCRFMITLHTDDLSALRSNMYGINDRKIGSTVHHNSGVF